MIRSFADKETEILFKTGASRRFGNIAAVAFRKLDFLDSAGALHDLRSPPGNRLEALAGGRKGQHSIRINDQRRYAFVGTRGVPKK